MAYLETVIAGERLSLLPERAIYWSSRKCLLLADLHIGKVSHFRRNGIAVPMAATASNEERLFLLLDSLDVAEVILLGDLFHSTYNDEWQLLERLTVRYEHVEFHLVEGNHDILHQELYEKARLIVHSDVMCIGPFVLSHEPLDVVGEGYNLCGHIHPGISLRGKGRQALRLPCFYFGPSVGILPAFGAFTGLYTLPAKPGHAIYAIADHQVVKV